VPARSPFRLEIPPHVADVIRHLPPDVKRGVKQALRAVGANPGIGAPLVGELDGFWKYRVRRFRIVYAIDRRRRLVRLLAVGHRRGIYDEASSLVRRD
jgi:mRNA interferase RelE/StbE